MVTKASLGPNNVPWLLSLEDKDPPESGTSPECNQIVFDPLSTCPEHFIIRSELF